MSRKSSYMQESEIVLGLLKALASDGSKSQRHLASELGIALGLVNVYLKRCITKGLVKISSVPKSRYAYYLTRKGFTEKARLTATYLTTSFSFFRQASRDCDEVLVEAVRAGFIRVVLVGKSDLANITLLCAIDKGVSVVAIVDPFAAGEIVAGVPVVALFEAVPADFDAVVVTSLENAQKNYQASCAAYGRRRVFVPELLSVTRA